MPRYLTGQNVFEAAERRFDWIWDEWETPVVSFSGGKDSTVVLNLAVRAAKRAGRLPVDVMFVDQECEWQMTIDYMRRVNARDDVKLHWLQVPFGLSNSASETDDWLHCWGPGEEWMREREPDSIHVNLWADRFMPLMSAYSAHVAGERSGIGVAGMRAEESPTRTQALVGSQGPWKWVTWYRRRGHHVCPIYDWSWRDIWKAIEGEGWDYCELYDKLWQHGKGGRTARLSSLSHEEAMIGVGDIAEIEPDTWEKLQRRLKGFNAARHLDLTNMVPSDLPMMFESWHEYRDYLLDNLVNAPEHQKGFEREFQREDKVFVSSPWENEYMRRCVRAVVLNDYHEEGGLAKWVSQRAKLARRHRAVSK